MPVHHPVVYYQQTNSAFNQTHIQGECHLPGPSIFHFPSPVVPAEAAVSHNYTLLLWQNYSVALEKAIFFSLILLKWLTRHCHANMMVSITETMYEGEWVNRSQTDIKRKTCDIQTWKKHLFLDISSTNIAILVPSFYQCVETRSTEVFWLLPQPLSHLRHQRNVCHRVVNPFTQQTLPTISREQFFMNILCMESFCPQKAHNRTLFFGSTVLK
jgi:hypothetical protein